MQRKDLFSCVAVKLRSKEVRCVAKAADAPVILALLLQVQDGFLTRLLVNSVMLQAGVSIGQKRDFLGQANRSFDWGDVYYLAGAEYTFARPASKVLRRR